MRIAVFVKQVMDPEAVLAFDESGALVQNEQNLIIDAYSEYAVERAVQLKEELGFEVIAVTIGDENSIPAVRHALSMGCSEAYQVSDPDQLCTIPELKAQVLAAVAKEVSADLVMGGCMSADTGRAQVMPRVAEILGLPHVNKVVEMRLEGNLVCTKSEVNDGIAEIDVQLPAVICAQEGLAEPRYPSMWDIMQTRKKTIQTRSVNEYATSCASTSHLAVVLRLKEARKSGSIIEGETLSEVVQKAVSALRDEAKVLWGA
ncbi:MAG: electron transfer flavoprotein subunit beta/FixA family protein [Coriobacteriia bacterium]|nr:electron transfer flavoprotein subunit beta/FixA family protein [Coriobacteriia bacterium]MCL2749643.1 electron transfer flavoprotein subunit beta/FixA family protein [Coriobacteriia bacterium]